MDDYTFILAMAAPFSDPLIPPDTQLPMPAPPQLDPMPPDDLDITLATYALSLYATAQAKLTLYQSNDSCSEGFMEAKCPSCFIC